MKNFHAILVVHHQVGNYDMKHVLFDLLNSLRTACRDRAAVADTFQAVRHRSGVGVIVVDDQDRVFLGIKAGIGLGFVHFGCAGRVRISKFLRLIW